MDAAARHHRDAARHRRDLRARLPSLASPDAATLSYVAARNVHGRDSRALHRSRLAARGARRPAAANAHDAASPADARCADDAARGRSRDCNRSRASAEYRQGSRRTAAPIRPRATTFRMADAAARVLDRIRRRDLGLAPACDLSARAALRRMARGRARMLFHHRADVLVPGHPAVAERRAMAAMGDAAVSAASPTGRTQFSPRSSCFPIA